MRITVMVCIGILVAACSGTMTTRPVMDDTQARGLRYLQAENVAIQVYSIQSRAEGDELNVIRLGDVIITTIPDPNQLFEVTYQGALFTSQTFKADMSDKGTIKKLSLDAKGSASAGAITGFRTLGETARDFDKTRQQQQIDDLKRQTDLIKARKDLEDALSKKSP